MPFKKNIGSITLPPGEYIIGDPCYVIHEDKWIPWLEDANYLYEERYYVADLDGHAVIGICTAHGDGLFEDQFGREYPVDAGLIGLVPVEVALPKSNGSSQVVNFDEPVECSWEDGTIVLGHIRIDTDQHEGDDLW